MVVSSRVKILQTLRQWQIPYTLFEHAPVHTMEDCLHIEGIDWEKTEMPKNVFLCNRQKTAFYLMLLCHGTPFRTAHVSKALGVSRLSFAPDALLPEMLGLMAGAVSPLGLLFDVQGRVALLMDRGLRGFERLAFHPCDNTATVVLSAQDFYGGFLKRIQRVPVEIDALAQT